MAKRQTRRGPMENKNEPLITETVAGRSVTRLSGPLPEFLAKKKAEQAAKTYDWYREAIGQFYDFLEASDRVTCGDITVATINLFRLEMRKRGLADNTISNRLRAVKAFARWMVEQEWIEDKQIKGLKVPQSTKPDFEMVPEDVLGKLFELYNPSTFLGARNVAIIATISDTGLRREEVVSLLIKNIDLEGSAIKAWAEKTDRWRWVPITPQAEWFLKNYLKYRELYFERPSRPRKDKDDDAERLRKRRKADPNLLFVTWKGTAMAPRELNNILWRASQKLGYRLHPHLFRHSFLTAKALDGENPSIVQRWAGHSTYSMTSAYFSLAEGKLGAIKPKSSTLSSIPLPGKRGRGRLPKAPVS